MRSTDIICDDCEVSHTTMRDETNMQHSREVQNNAVVYRFVDGWMHVPLALSGIDICPKCSKKKLNLSALAAKVRKHP